MLDTSKKFGRWTVKDEQYQGDGKQRKKMYCCRCECGVEKWIRKSSLLCGDSKSCGCLRSDVSSERAKKKIGPRLNLNGMRFGYLVVMKAWRRERSGKSYVTKWKCKCKCGKEKWIQSCSLIQQNTQSCGCLQKEIVSAARKLEPGLAAKRSIYAQYRLRSRRKGLDFSISLSDFLILSEQKCHYCGSQHSNKCVVEGGNGEFLYNGLDRRNNKLGYTIDNVAPCCKICNVAKSVMSEKEFFEWIKQVYDHMRSRSQEN